MNLTTITMSLVLGGGGEIHVLKCASTCQQKNTYPYTYTHTHTHTQSTVLCVSGTDPQI